jgi:flagellar FliL protein
MGTQLAHIGSMPDVQANPASENASRNTRKKKRGGMAVVLVLGLVAAGGLIWWEPQRSTSASEGVAESTLPLEPFVVNLTGSSQRAFLRVGITLGFTHPFSTRKQAEAVPTALVRDTILSVLATAQPEELLQLEGKRRLKDELLKALQDRVPQIAVENVYFTEFLVQM